MLFSNIASDKGKIQKLIFAKLCIKTYLVNSFSDGIQMSENHKAYFGAKITLDKVPSGAHIPRPALPPLFKEHKVCSFDSGDGSCMLYVITLKKFNHT